MAVTDSVKPKGWTLSVATHTLPESSSGGGVSIVRPTGLADAGRMTEYPT